MRILLRFPQRARGKFLPSENVPRDTPGARLFQIRLACGDGVRTAETMALFAQRVQAATGRWFDPSTLSLLERDQQEWKLAHVTTFAFVDPQERGRPWLACFDIPAEPPAIVGTIQPDMPPNAK